MLPEYPITCVVSLFKPPLPVFSYVSTSRALLPVFYPCTFYIPLPVFALLPEEPTTCALLLTYIILFIVFSLLSSFRISFLFLHPIFLLLSILSPSPFLLVTLLPVFCPSTFYFSSVFFFTFSPDHPTTCVFILHHLNPTTCVLFSHLLQLPHYLCFILPPLYFNTCRLFFTVVT